MLDLGDLRAFYCVGKLGGIGAAARRLEVTQPAISQRMRALERRIGKPLYGMAGRQLVLTEDGRRLYAACRQAFDLLESIDSAMAGREQEVVGTVRLAAISEFGKAYLIPRMLAFRETHPQVEFDLQYRLPYEMLSSLSRHDVDISFSNEPFRRPQIELASVLTEFIVLVGPGPARRLGWKTLAELPWIGYGPEDPLWFELSELARHRGVKLPQPALRVADVESVLRLAAQGRGYALAPRHALPLRKLKGLVIHGLPCGGLKREVTMGRLKTVPMGTAARLFWEHCLRGIRPEPANLL